MSTRLGRAEQAVNRSLSHHPELAECDRAVMRCIGRAFDFAEHERDHRGTALIAKAYLEVRQAVGLGESLHDPFMDFVATLGHPEGVDGVVSQRRNSGAGWEN